MANGIGLGSRHLEMILPLQGVIEGLDPQQILARDALVAGEFFSLEEATEFVKMIGAEVSAKIKDMLVDPLTIKEDIERMLSSALQ